MADAPKEGLLVPLTRRDLLVLLEVIGRHVSYEAVLDDVGINMAAYFAGAPMPMNAPRTCVLTGAEGENPDDCTTHEHEAAR